MKKIDAETWATMSKAQKRAARKKLAAEKFHAAVLAADRRDADFIARHTGTLSGKSKGSDIMAFVPTKQKKECYRVLDICMRNASITDESKVRNANWAGAQSLASLKRFDALGNEDTGFDTRFVPAVKSVFDSSEIALGDNVSGEERAIAATSAVTSRAEAERLFSQVRPLFNGQYSMTVDFLKKKLTSIETELTAAKLAADEAIVSAGKDPKNKKLTRQAAQQEELVSQLTARREEIEKILSNLIEGKL